MIPVQNAGIPDLSVASELGKQDNFSLMIPRHRKSASALTDIFLSELKKIPQASNFNIKIFRGSRHKPTSKLCCLRP
jgi:hypothetical protein